MKKIIFVTIFSVWAVLAYSQESFTALQYSMGFGTGDMHDFIKPASFRGFTIDYRGLIQPNVGIGVDVSWNVFYDAMPSGVYHYKNIDYSGKQYRYSNHFPILTGIDYYFKPGGLINPFAGLAIGTMYSQNDVDMGTYTFELEGWRFAMRPELGVILDAAPGVGFMIASKYYYGFKAGDMPAQGYFTLNFGIVLSN
jgi:hypothetical protein